MEAVLIPAKTVVHINGVPVRLATDTIIEIEHGNMAQLTGYHYAHLHGSETPSAAVRVESVSNTSMDKR